MTQPFYYNHHPDEKKLELKEESMSKKSLVRSFLILAIIGSITSLFAQDVDHVYLKNGSVIRGNILEIDPVDHVKILDLCGNIWYYKITDVEKITSEPFQADFKEKKEYESLETEIAELEKIVNHQS